MANSSAEWFDVVDAQDRVIGRETRAEVHRRRLLHRAVHIFVYRSTGEVFLQKRSATKDTAPLKWVTSCSGHVDAGEGYEEAARRELGEEIGIPGEPVEMAEVARIPAVPETGHEFVRVYVLRGYDRELILDPEEIAEGCWKQPREVDQWLARRPEDFSTSFRYLWPRLS